MTINVLKRWLADLEMVMSWISHQLVPLFAIFSNLIDLGESFTIPTVPRTNARISRERRLDYVARSIHREHYLHRSRHGTSYLSYDNSRWTTALGFPMPAATTCGASKRDLDEPELSEHADTDQVMGSLRNGYVG